MTKKLLAPALLIGAAFPWQASASTVDFSFAGSGVSGVIHMTYGTATDAKYSQAFEVTAISGTFTDLNSGVSTVNAPIVGLEPVKHDPPEPTNLLAPNDFSRFAVGAGLPADNGGFLTYDNLFWPAGSPPTASDYPVHGGILDIYGVMFDIGGGRVVDLYSNGDFTGTGIGPIDYGIGVATSSTSLDYVGGVAATPEPGALELLGSGLLGMWIWRRNPARRKPE